jgi:cytochrome c-type biogenesis protein CcmH/NrfG
VAQTYRQPSADQAPQKFVEQLRTMLGTDPDNTRILTNLGAVYDLVLTPATNAPASWTLSAPERGKFEKERESLKALIKQT